MIFFVTTAWHSKPVKSLVDGRFGFELPECQWVPYETLFRSRRLPLGTYIFTDLERLGYWEIELASKLFEFLTGKGLRCLNDPAKVRTRVELLRLLAQEGISDVGVWRADERPTPGRFPVFIRGESDHAKPLSDLIATQAALDERLDALRNERRSLRGLIVLEHRPGTYNGELWHKWGTFRVSNDVFVEHLAVDATWLVKYGDYAFHGEDVIRDEHDGVLNNRFGDQLRRCFELAEIDYGRADHAVVDGELLVYEINTNPNIGPWVPGKHPLSLEKQRHARERLAAALFSIDTSETGHIPFDVKEELFLRIRRNPKDVPFWRA
jgi:hypothetical protein